MAHGNSCRVDGQGTGDEGMSGRAELGNPSRFLASSESESPEGESEVGKDDLRSSSSSDEASSEPGFFQVR